MVGQPKQIPVIIRGKKPFKIESLQKQDGPLGDAFTVKKFEKTTSTVHSLPITITAPNVPGVFEVDFYIQIEGRLQPIIFKARGRILDRSTGKN
jgi:hypothetical protein